MLQFLLTLADESNHSKIEHIYNTYHASMLKYACSRFELLGRENPAYDAEDAVQNAFIKIVKHIDKLNFDRGEKEIKNYVFGILTNEIHNIANVKEDVLELDEDFPDLYQYNPIELLEITDEYNRIVKAIEGLDEIYSATMFLAINKEMSITEIAELMGISRKTVYTRLERGRVKLINALKGANKDE